MRVMDAITFSSLLGEAAKELFPQARLQISITRITRLKARLNLSADRYVDIFFREETQRVDYALIVSGERVFGLDNLGGWHCHPFGATEQHIPCAEPTPEEALKRIKQVIGLEEELRMMQKSL